MFISMKNQEHCCDAMYNYLSANELSETLTGMIVFIASSFF